MRNKLLNKFYKFYKIMFINFLNNKCSWTIFVFLILNYICLFVFLFSKLSMIPLYLPILSFSLWNLIVIFLYYFCILFYFYAFCDSLYVLFSVLLLTYFLLCTFWKKNICTLKTFYSLFTFFCALYQEEKTEINIHIEKWIY